MQFKLMIKLLLLFSFSVAVINILVSTQIQYNYEKQIESDLLQLQTNAEIYIRQALILGELNNEESSFHAVILDELLEIGAASGNDLAAYTNQGAFLAETSSGLFSSITADDLNYALQGEAAFTMVFKGRSGLDVLFACPVVIEGKTIGILRFYTDYSFRRQQGQATEQMVLIVTVLVFIFTFIVVQLMAHGILNPMQLLAKDSARVARRIGTSTGGEASEPVKAMAHRRDEIGELAANYEQMVTKINEQFLHIQSDRDHIRDLYDYAQNFFNNITHELKTPLTTIQGYAELLQTDAAKDPAFYSKGMQHIIDESKRLHEMVIQLLEMSDLKSRAAFTPVNLSDLTVSLTETMSLKAKRYGNSFELNIQPHVMIYGQVDRLRELLINLLDNAIKYGEENQVIPVQLQKINEQICLSISNGGAGIPANQVNRIFAPFYRVKDPLCTEKGSSGLGLSICEKIVSDHGGSIFVESVPNEYTTFSVTFPPLNTEEEYPS